MEKLKNFPRIIIIVSLFLVASTLAAWYITKSVVEKQTARLFNDEITIIENWITNRFESYKTIAYGLQGFSAGSQLVTKEEWQAYLETLKIKERFPGITAISLAKRIDNNYIISYIYPPEKETTIGINITVKEGHSQAINLAIDNASIAITDKVILITDQSPGFVMFAPIYKTGLPINTIKERRTAIKSLVAIVFKSEQVFKSLFDAHDPFPHLDFELYKGKVLEENHILYDHDYSHYIPKTETHRLETKRTIISNGETFTLLVSSKPSFGLKTLEEQLPNIVLISGLVFSALIFIFAITGFRKL